jgi:hypothetical protein
MNCAPVQVLPPQGHTGVKPEESGGNPQIVHRPGAQQLHVRQTPLPG